MGIWEILGIAPTRDRGAIEKAYAQQRKFSDPQSDPQNWQRLQEAYRKAMDHAGGHDAGVDDRLSSGSEPPQSPAPESVSPEAEIAAGQIQAELETLYSNPGWRNDLQRWRAQLEGERAHQAGVTEVLRYQVFDFLSRQPDLEDQALDSRILDYLEWRLGWQGHREVLTERFGERRVHHLLGAGEPHPGEADVPEADPEQVPPKGLGFALIGWVVALMILTIVFGELTGS